MEEPKKASNFELNVLKLGKHRIQLVKGDKFTSNGHTFDYVPSTAENKGKGTKIRYSGRVDNISAKKYKKDVLRADNIKLVLDRPLGKDIPENAEYNVHNRFRVWEVQYAYTVPPEQHDPLIQLKVELDHDGEWQFESNEIPVERETNETIFLKGYEPINYLSRIEKNRLGLVFVKQDQYSIIGRIDDYDQLEMDLFKSTEEKIEEKLNDAKKHLKRREILLSKFLIKKQKQGY